MSSLTPYLSGIMLILGAQTVALISPGAAVFAIMNLSLEKGRARGMAMGLGVGFGSFILASTALLGLAKFVLMFPKMIALIEFIGGFYFLYLGIKTLLSIKKPLSIALENDKEKSIFQYWLTGVFIQLLNPKSILVWLGLGALGLGAGAPMWVAATVAVLALINSMFWNVLYALVFSAPYLTRKYKEFAYVFKTIFAAAFIGIAILLWRKMF